MNTDTKHVSTRIISKLRALLARADAARNDNEHEREIALRHATRLMDEHNISMADTSDEALDDSTRTKEALTIGSQRYRSQVYAIVCKLYSAKCVVDGSGRHKRVFVIGTDTQRATVFAVSAFLTDSVEREARELAGMGRSYITSWKRGAAAGIHSTVLAMLKERQDKPASGAGTDLVVLYDQQATANAAWMRKEFGQLITARTSRPRNADGYKRGREYGSNLVINRPLT